MIRYYDLELDNIQQLVKEKQYKKILIQMPEGMLDTSLKALIDVLTPLTPQIIVTGDPSYGICDLATNLASRLKCDLLVHFGHNEFGFKEKIKYESENSLDVLIIPAFVTIAISSHFTELNRKLKELKWLNVGLIGTIQHLGNIQEIKEYFDSMGIHYVIQEEGQMIGCDISNVQKLPNDIDGIISLNAGYFHIHGLLLNTSLPILQLNPFSGEIKLFTNKDRNKLINKRHAIISHAHSANNWGILGSSKIGQYHPKTISRVEKVLQDHNKMAIVIIAETINFDNLTNFTWIDAWVDTACPRLALDDQIKFDKPILTLKEFLYLFKEITWDQILTNGFF